MELVFYFIAKIIDLTLGAVSLAMLVRAILPLILREGAEDNKLYIFAFVVSEPFVTPFRFILYKLNIGQDLPIDLSFFAAYMGIMLIRMFLPVI